MADRKEVMTWLKICGMGDCSGCCPYRNGEVRASTCYEQLMTDALSLLKEQEEAEEEAGGTLDKLIKETQDLLSKSPTDFEIVKGIIERSSLRKHFDEATIETGEHIITLRHGADEVDLLFDKDGRIE